MADNENRLMSGTVKAVTSGDVVTVIGAAKGGPPPEKNIKISNINAPQLGWKNRPDQPFAWAAREALRSRLIGQTVQFRTFTPKNGGGGSREYGDVIHNGDDIAEWLVTEGWATVRLPNNNREPDERVSAMVALQEEATEAGRGMHTQDAEAIEGAVRDVKWSGSYDARELHEELGGEPVMALIDHVRDGSSLRCLLLPSFHQVTLFLAGIRAPNWKRSEDPEKDDEPMPFAPQAKFFVEMRLLHRCIPIRLEVPDNRGNFYGTVLHPAGNISVMLLREGMAKVVDWSAAQTSYAPELRAAEEYAKGKRLRLWRNWNPVKSSVTDAMVREFDAKCVEVVSADTLVVKMPESGLERRIYLSSVRGPRLRRRGKSDGYAYEAREYIRKQVIGKTVHVALDYIREPPEDSQYTELREYATVFVNDRNVGVSLVAAGLATVIRHREDEERSYHFDELMSSQVEAERANLGMHANKEAPVYFHSDLSGDKEALAKFFDRLRGTKTKCYVDYVINGGRLKIMLPRDRVIVPFILEGMRCPRYDGRDPEKCEQWAPEARDFTRDMVFQRDVEIEVNDADRGGTLIGTLWFKKKNVSTLLLREGLAWVSERSASASPYENEYFEAHDAAKSSKINYWSTYVEPVVEEESDDDEDAAGTSEPSKEFYDVVVTEVSGPTTVWVQIVGDGTESLSQFMEEFAAFHASAEAVSPVGFTPKKGGYCAGQFTADDCWYRGRITARNDDGTFTVLFIDYGNSENLPADRLRALSDDQLGAIAPQAKLCKLALVLPPKDSYLAGEAVDYVREMCYGQQLVANVEFRNKEDKSWHVSLFDAKDQVNITSALLRAGLVRVDNNNRMLQRGNRFDELVEKLRASEAEAKDSHYGMWEFGDIDYDEPDMDPDRAWASKLKDKASTSS